MRYAILSDIHGNWEAFQAVLREIRRIGVDRLVCLGDIVGYGASPNECIEAVRENEVVAIKGNHDIEACRATPPEYFNAEAHAAIVWTRRTLTTENAAFLAALPETAALNRSTLACHGSPRNAFEYILNAATAGSVLADLEENYSAIRLLFFGHTHIQAYISTMPRDKIQDINQAFTLSKGYKHLINPGSVGQPRDGSPTASFLLFDSSQRLVEFHNVEYDTRQAASKILAAGLPSRLAFRLCAGL